MVTPLITFHFIFIFEFHFISVFFCLRFSGLILYGSLIIDLSIYSHATNGHSYPCPIVRIIEKNLWGIFTRICLEKEQYHVSEEGQTDIWQSRIVSSQRLGFTPFLPWHTYCKKGKKYVNWKKILKLI